MEIGKTTAYEINDDGMNDEAHGGAQRATAVPRGVEQAHEYFAGLDLGQIQDPATISIVERVTVTTGEIDYATYERACETYYWIRYLERIRLGTSYAAIVEHVKRVTGTRGIAGRCTLVADATGVGAPVMDLLREARLACPLVPVIITGGEAVTKSGASWRVPKRDLIMGLQVMFQERQIRISESLPDAAALVRELMSMRVKISATGHDSYGAASGAREGPHDDLVLATALAAWRAKRWGKREIFMNRSLGLGY